MSGALSECVALAVFLSFSVGCQKIENQLATKKLDVAKASAPHDDDEAGDVDGGEALEQLARQDWPRAEPILRRAAASGMPRTVTLAQVLLYEHLAPSGDAAAHARELLKKTAEDRKAPGYCRATAAEALLSSDWDGRDDWYLTLFKDDTIRYLHDGLQLHIPLQGPVRSNPDHWIPILTKLLASKNRAVHDSAVTCLVQFNSKSAKRDALTPLLPWLFDRNWSSVSNRLELIQSMDQLDLKESVPGLISVLGESGNEDEKSWAAEALGHFKDPRAVPALRKALDDKQDLTQLRRIVQGLAACGGVSANEAAQGVEAYLKLVGHADGQKKWESYESFGSARIPADVAIGSWIAREGARDQQVVDALAARARELKSSNPALAAAIQTTVAGWSSEGADRQILREIRDGSATNETIQTALQRRAELRETVGDGLKSLEAQHNSAGALGALLLGDHAGERAILNDANKAEAQKTLLTYARQIREKLPVQDVGKLWDSRDSGVAEAAGKYLETEDSPDARRLYLSRHPGEALILGLRTDGDPGHFSFPAFDQLEDQLRNQVRGNRGVEIYGLLTAGYWGDAGQILVSKSGAAAELKFIEDGSRYYSRQLTANEVDQLGHFVRDQKVDDLPLYDTGTLDGLQLEFVHITKDGGRRVFMNNPGFDGENEHAKLCHFFVKLAGASHLPLHYKEAAKMPGFKILFADKRVFVNSVSAQGGELRFLAVFEPKGRANKAAMEDDGEWHLGGVAVPPGQTEWLKWQNQKLLPVEHPADFPDVNPNQAVPEKVEKDLRFRGRDDRLWGLTLARKSYRAAEFDKRAGLWEFSSGARPRLIREGDFFAPVLTPDGRFAFVAGHKGNSWAHPNFISKINLRTGEAVRVNVAWADRVRPIAYVAARSSVLVVRQKEPTVADPPPLRPEAPEYWLVNTNTGEAKVAQGEFAPFDDEGRRPLQPTGAKNRVWAAIAREKENATDVGIYDLKKFSLTRVLRVPGLQFRSGAMYVDVAMGKLYVCYRGHLLAMDIVLPKNQ